MIEEFKYENQEIRGVTSLTLSKEDILKLHNDLLELMDGKKPQIKYTIITSVNRKSFTHPKNIDFLKISESIGALIIEYNIPKVMEMEIYLSTYEKGAEIPGFRSLYNINCNDETLMLSICNYLDKFIKKKKNYHYIFHQYAAYISVPLGGLLIYFLNKIFDIPEYANLALMVLVPFYVFTRTFRWLMPYTYFPEENNLKGKLRYILLTLILGLVATGVWDIGKSIVTNAKQG